jgi:soluble lytic murein transglycosylase-like protein
MITVPTAPTAPAAATAAAATTATLAARTASPARSLAHLGAFALVALFSAGTEAACWHAAGTRYGIDPALLAAVAAVESAFDPKAVNRSHRARTGSEDIGLMQINTRWLPQLAQHGVTREALLDPCTSVTVGAWILAGLFARYGTTWEAVGAYHAGCTRLDAHACATTRAAYARRVHAALRRPDVAAAAALPTSSRRSASPGAVE